MVKKSKDQDELKKFEYILKTLDKYPDLKALFLQKDLEVIRKALQNQTSIPRDSSLRIQIAIVRLHAKIGKTGENRKPKSTKSETGGKLKNIRSTDDKLVKKLQKNIADKNRRIEELKDRIKELESESEGQVKELEEKYRNILDSKDKEILELEKEKNKLDLNNKSLESEKNKLKRRLKNKGSSELQSKYDSLKVDFKESENENKRLIEDNNKAQETIQRLNSEIEEKDKTIESLEEEINSFKDPEKLLNAFVSVVQEDARSLAIEAAKDLLEKELSNYSSMISSLTKNFNSRFSEVNDRFNNLQALVQQEDTKEEIHESDPDFSDEDLKIMKNLNILFVQNGSYKNLSQTHDNLLNSFGGKSEFFTKADRTSKTKNTLRSAIEGKKFDYIVLYLDGISHTITDGINEYQEPKIILVRKGLENHILIKGQILERYRQHKNAAT